MEVYTILFNRLISEAAKRQVSDLHLSVGSIPVVRKDGRLMQLEGEKLIEQDVLMHVVNSFLDEREKMILNDRRELTTVKTLGGNFRFKINIYYQKKLLAASFRLVPSAPGNFASLNLPKIIGNFTKLINGLVIVAGPYGSGKTSTIGALVENINVSQKKRILTLERPVEILFVSKQSIIEQRDIGVDVKTFSEGLRYCQHEDIDVLVVSYLGENLCEALPIIFEIATSNCLVYLEMQADSIDRVLAKLLDCFPVNKSEANRMLLADVLEAVILQKLIPKIGGEMALAAEVLTGTSAARAVIRDGRISQLQTIMQTSVSMGMISMNQSLLRLVESGQISRDEAAAHAANKDDFSLMIKD
ncbi:MAG: ATPase, T2SS/T4P/T4SS family [bacterium]|nr:ATPase, T2SS/T4P/T4SS family [bacterium]